MPDAHEGCRTDNVLNVLYTFMAITDFNQWLTEKGKRTALGIYPALYGSGQYPPLAFAPTSATHMLAFAKIHNDEHPDLLKDFIKKDGDPDEVDTMGKKHKKKKGHSKKGAAKKKNKKKEDD